MDQVVAEPLQQARVAPRPDPLPFREESRWATHAPWVGGAAVLGAAMALGSPSPTGLVACGAGGMAVFLPLVGGRWRAAVRALHLAAGVVLLALWNGSAAAGEFALAAGLVAVATLATRAAASGVRVSVAPLAGRMPGRFGDLHRRGATRFAVGGISAALFTAVLGVSPAMQIALLAPPFGPAGAAWALVAAETLLFGSAALTLTRRTNEPPFTVGHFTAVVSVGRR